MSPLILPEVKAPYLVTKHKFTFLGKHDRQHCACRDHCAECGNVHNNDNEGLCPECCEHREADKHMACLECGEPLVEAHAAEAYDRAKAARQDGDV